MANHYRQDPGDPFALYREYQASPDGIRVMREPENHAYIAWKVRCAGCRQAWGEWEQFAFGDDRSLSEWPVIDHLVRARLRGFGFSVLQGDAVLCPRCQGKPFELPPLAEYLPSESIPWFTEVQEAFHAAEAGTQADADGALDAEGPVLPLDRL